MYLLQSLLEQQKPFSLQSRLEYQFEEGREKIEILKTVEAASDRGRREGREREGEDDSFHFIFSSFCICGWDLGESCVVKFFSGF